MADPLSIASACLSIVDASLRLSDRIRAVVHLWRHAPTEIIALHNEISDLTVVLDHCRMAVRNIQATDIQAGRTGTPDVPADLGQQLRKVETILSQLEGFLDELMAIPGLRKRFQWVKRSSFASTKKDEIRDVRMRINDMLAAHNA